MSKRVIRDISPGGGGKRSIRDIKRSDAEEEREMRDDTYAQEEVPQQQQERGSAIRPRQRGRGGRIPPRRPRRPRREGDNGGRPRYVIWGLALGGVVIVLFALSTIFSGATIGIVPTQATVTLDDAFTAYADASEGKLAYEHIVVEGNVSKSVAATGEKEVSQKASGQIVIYNTYSSRDQRLIRNTRFKSPDGKIYRIRDSVVVPGTTVEQGEVVPGQVTVTVYADQPGEEYNIGLTDFTIPGFKGDPRYEDFYARSKTEMSGGFEGTVNTVAETTASQTKEALREELTDQLLQKAYAQVPEDFILYQDAAFRTFNEPDIPEQTQADEVTFTVEGTLRGVIFDREALSEHIAYETLPNYDGAPILIRDLDDLSFSIQGKDAITNPLDRAEITFLISGTAHFEWLVDADALRQELRGVKRDTFPEIVKGYPAIKRAEASLMPFWSTTFPESPGDITVEVDHTTPDK